MTRPLILSALKSLIRKALKAKSVTGQSIIVQEGHVGSLVGTPKSGKSSRVFRVQILLENVGIFALNLRNI